MRRALLLTALIALTCLSLVPGAARAGIPACGPTSFENWKDFDGDGERDLTIGAPGETVNGFAGAGGVHVLYGTNSGPSADGDEFWSQASAGIASAPDSSEQMGEALAAGDFNGDGCGDLAAGVKGQDVGGVSSAGSVHVIYGSPSGLSSTGAQYWHENVTGIAGTPGDAEFFGYALDVGLLDGDDFADLAITALYSGDTGAVHVLYGSAAGLAAVGSQLWSQDSPGINGSGFDCQSEFFGTSLSIANYDGDAFGDLAIGVPGEDLGDVGGDCSAPDYRAETGAVNVIYGSASGLTADGDQLIHQDSVGVPSPAQEGDRFGEELHRGDFDGDGITDLAVGVPGENAGGVSNAGAVNVLLGSGGGLGGEGEGFVHQGSAGVLGDPGADDRFGAALAGGDFGGTAHADLAIGVPGEDVGGQGDGGGVNVLVGSASGLSATGDQLWTQDTPGIPDAASAGDRFGEDLGRGDHDGDGGSDLVIGVPSEDAGAVVDTGVVQVLFGFAGGLSTAGNQYWSQDSPGVLRAPAAGDRFGSVIAGTR